MKAGLYPLIASLVARNASTEIVFKPVEQQQGDTVLEGLWVYDPAIQGERPAPWLFTSGRGWN